MDFFSIFQNNTTSNDDNKKKVVKKKTSFGDTKDTLSSNKSAKLRDNYEQQDTFTDDVDKQRHDADRRQDVYNTTLYKNIKKGDYLKIIGVKDSHLNSYKGYTGEIKDYKKDQDFALVFLHGVNNVSIVKFPINHFIITD